MDRDWTDKRIDDFRGDVNRRFEEVDRRFDAIDRRFDKVDTRFDKFEGEVKAGFEKAEAASKERSANSDAAIAAVDKKFGKLESKADTTNRTLWVGIFVAVIVKLITG